MTTFTIRAAKPEDAANVTALLEKSYATLMAADYDAPTLAAALPLIARANPKLLQAPTYYVAETPSGNLIGCGGWTPEKPGSGTVDGVTGHIRHFATVPDCIRQGVARTLIGRCFDDARAQNLHHLDCYSSLSAVAFYAACGFRVLGPIDIPLTEDCIFPSVHMACDL